MHLLTVELPYLAFCVCLGYLDPASGSMLLQILLGGIAGAAVVLKLGWRHIVAYLAYRFSQKKSDPDLISMASNDSPDSDESVAEPTARRAA
jgi:hypothetical protein